MKIVQTPIRFWPYIGGVENHVYYLSKELVKQGHEITVLCANEPKTKITEKDGIKVKKLNYWFKIANTNIMPTFPFALWREDFDIVHTHMPTPFTADLSVLIAKMKGKKSIMTIHNDMDKEGIIGKIITQIYLKTIFKITLKLVDKIVIVNNNWQESFISTRKLLSNYKDKIVTIPNGIDLNLFKPKKSNKEGLLFISVLDNHHDYKGLNYLLKSIKMLKEKGIKTKLNIVGDGKRKEYYREVVEELGLKNEVQFLGSKKQEELPEIYSKNKVFILPSTSIEGFGLVLLESLACKTPVITTPIAGISKKIGKNNCGIIIPQKDAESLARAILRIISNPKIAQKMAENGRKLVERDYSWRKISQDVENLYFRVTR